MDFYHKHGLFGISSWIFRVIVLDNSDFTLGFFGLLLAICQEMLYIETKLHIYESLCLKEN